MKYILYKNSLCIRTQFTENKLLFCLCFYLFLTYPVTEVYAQLQEKGTPEVLLAETGIAIKVEDFEKARMRAGEVKANADKSIKELESFISNLQSDAETTDVYLEGLQQEKKAYQAGTTNPEFLEILDKELVVIKQKIDVDNEQIEAYKDQITALQNQAKVYADWVMVLGSAVKLVETLAVTPLDQFSTAKKEADIAKGYITAVQENLKEKETLVSHFTRELEYVKVQLSTKEQDLTKSLEFLKAKIQEEVLIKVAQEKIKGIVRVEKDRKYAVASNI